MSLCYFDVFPDARLSVATVPNDKGEVSISPSDIHHFVTSLFGTTGQRATCPKSLKVNHIALMKHVFFVLYEGLDKSRFDKYRSSLGNFEKLSENGFPVVSLAEEKNWMIKPGYQTVIGYSAHPTKRVQFNSIEEMLLNPAQLFDNGYPITSTDLPEFKRPLRCKHYGIEPLTPEELREYQELPDKVDGALDAIAIDCEMIETDCGNELARVSGTKEDGSVVIDVIFKPKGKIVDLRTDKSGITEEMLDKATVTSDKCVEMLAQVADKHTIIIGHSLENDLRAMKLIHNRVVDTAILYRGDAVYPAKPGLARIYAKYIHKPFREDLAAGHDSAEDARAAFDLVTYAMGQACCEVECPPTVPKLLFELRKTVVRVDVVSPSFGTTSYEGIDENIKIINNDSTPELTTSLTFQMKGDPAPFTYSYFTELSRCQVNDEEEEQACKEYNQSLGSILESLPPQSILIVYTGNGNLKRLRTALPPDGKRVPLSENAARNAELQLCRQALLWIYTTNNK